MGGFIAHLKEPEDQQIFKSHRELLRHWLSGDSVLTQMNGLGIENFGQRRQRNYRQRVAMTWQAIAGVGSYLIFSSAPPKADMNDSSS